ncbi:hypothetical protein [Marinobacterium jannaschii]|uniref:hypothetical protein n=1 Tax=Marinobacterium jannaschii TaxID=64970 RepID=UPI00047FB658|nr:hypothetical protein [Marinobacterium jannaschii]
MKRTKTFTPTRLSVALTLVFGLTYAHAEVGLERIRQIDEGSRLFNEETFEGNGRTCGTCHIPSEQYNIFPSTIRKLKGDDLAKVLASNVPGLENPTLVLKRALFNTEGGIADPPTSDGVHPGPFFRGSMTVGPIRDASDCGGHPAPFPLPDPAGAEAEITTRLGPLPQLGWAAIGSPRGGFHHGNVDTDANGCLRAFANGAIAQHFTLNLLRKEKGNNPGLTPGAGDDNYHFRFATGEELDAMDTFQQWLGRREQFFVTNPATGDEMVFSDPRAEAGKEIFLSNEAGCNVCHANGGAGFNPAFVSRTGINISQHSDVNKEAERLSRLTGVHIPEDEGNAVNPPGPPDEDEPEAFNIQPVIEAVRKKSFFHNHAVLNRGEGRRNRVEACGGIEGASMFYFREPFLGSDIHAALHNVLGNPNLADRTGNPHSDSIEEFLEKKGKDAFALMGAFMRSWSAFYSLRDCERLVDETIERINHNALATSEEEKVSASLAAEHCAFNLEDTRDVLRKVDDRKHRRGGHGDFDIDGLDKVSFDKDDWGPHEDDPFIGHRLSKVQCGVHPAPYPEVRIATYWLKHRLKWAVRQGDVAELESIRQRIVELRKRIATTTELPD